LTHRSPPAPARLLEAALEEFAAHGRAGARTGQIAARAGVNKQLIHYYYQTKDGLYAAVLVHAAAAVAGELARLPLVGLTAVERLRRLVRGQFDFFLQHPGHTAVLVQADDAGGWADQSVKPVADLLRQPADVGLKSIRSAERELFTRRNRIGNEALIAFLLGQQAGGQ